MKRRALKIFKHLIGIVKVIVWIIERNMIIKNVQMCSKDIRKLVVFKFNNTTIHHHSFGKRRISNWQNLLIFCYLLPFDKLLNFSLLKLSHQYVAKLHHEINFKHSLNLNYITVKLLPSKLLWRVNIGILSATTKKLIFSHLRIEEY